MFRKILNQEKPTKKRDCIIAICVALQLLPGEIDEALVRYQYMPTLDENNPRDGFIIAQIKGSKGITVKELNNRLLQRGFPGLDIQDGRSGKTKSKDSVPVDLPFKVMEMKVRTPIDTDYYYGDPYNSLCTTYDPSRCRSTGDMILGDPRRKKYIHLIATTDGYRSAKVIKDEPLPTPFESLDETGDYKNYFIKLENAINIEKHRLLDILNDTRNYQKRTSAIFSGDSICIFTEQFNYVIPELNEYYVLTLSAGHYKLYVYDQSAFMFWYLSKESYSSYFGSNYPEPKETFESIEELEALINANINSDESTLFRIRRNAFKRLMPDVDDLYQKIKEGKEFIQNLDCIFDNPVDVLRYYELERDFECKYDEEYGEICNSLDSKTYSLPDGSEITITLEDLYKAFEFGLPDIETICRIKAKYGSIDAVLN